VLDIEGALLHPRLDDSAATDAGNVAANAIGDLAHEAARAP
jgi:hypothetical protein